MAKRHRDAPHCGESWYKQLDSVSFTEALIAKKEEGYKKREKKMKEI